MKPRTPGTSTLGDAIVEHIAEAVIYANREGSIERWNAAAARMFGFSAEEARPDSLLADSIAGEPARRQNRWPERSRVPVPFPRPR